MKKCNICGTKQKQTGVVNLSFGDGKPIGDVPRYNINLLTYIKCKSICDNCMDTYYKIYALYFDKDFSCGGVEYFADGRNLD